MEAADVIVIPYLLLEMRWGDQAPTAPSPTPDSYCWVSVRAAAWASMRIGRGFFSSGSSRCSSMESKPFCSLALVTRTWSASWKRRSKSRAPMPR